MQTIDGENDLLLTCAHTQDGVCILRCETRDPLVRLPDEIGGAPVTALGEYALSARAPVTGGRETFCCRVCCGGPAPTHDARAIRRVVLPRGLRRVGRYAFFGCRALEALELTGAVADFGGGALMNCAAFRAVRLTLAENAPSCLQKLLGETAGEIEVTLDFGETQARLLFPAYSEDLEDLSPAHIFQRRIHGAGYAYRQCFENGRLLFAQYDRALPRLLERHDFEVAARLALRRLQTPYALGAEARERYLACLRAHGGALARSLAAAGSARDVGSLLSLAVLSPADLAAACDAARDAGQTETLSVLLAAGDGKTAAGRSKAYTF